MATETKAIATRGALDARVQVPGSKSISNRVLLLAGLADGVSELSGLLESDDTRVMAQALRALGATLSGQGADLRVAGTAGKPLVPPQGIDVHASGTAARFLTAALALVPGECVIDGVPRMRQRPIGDLVDALRALGVDADALSPGGCPPVRVRGGAPFGGAIEIDASRSSQYVSALLQIGPYAARPLTLRLRDGVLASRPYVDVTLQVMRAFGASAGFRDAATLEVEPGRGYRGQRHQVEPDASTAAYFFAAAAIAGGRVRVEGLPGDSAQADMGLLAILERMGCEVSRQPSFVEVRGPTGTLRPIDEDMNALPDAVLAAAVTALFASGTSTIRNIAHLRLKESDRLAALGSELQKLGAQVKVGTDSLTITPPAALRGAEIATHDDHRMAMAFALAGLRVPGVRILEPGCVAKSWPRYFEAFDALG
jgi:3-phosphoshikimate 1-carboxyvinyltransferase